PSWWNANRRADAERTFDRSIVEAFYDEIQAGRADPWSIREAQIPLPDAALGYSRVLFVGTTGAGKTSLLRHFIGSDHLKDRFPSTSTARTTIADTEVILSDGPYLGVVTFSSEFLVRADVEECVLDACAAALEGANPVKIAERLLNHRDQKFRLSYTLGSISEPEPTEEDDWAFANQADAPGPDDEDAVADEERRANARALKGFVQRVEQLSKGIANTLAGEIGAELDELVGIDLDTAQESFAARVEADDAFDDLVGDMIDAVKQRFDKLNAGDLTRSRSGWPLMWNIETDDRSDFIRKMRWFSSNYAPQFGQLLTPVVDGVRVKGPLYPTFTKEQPRLALLDGQGIGHTPDSSASVTTHVTQRFSDVDVILLVDNAQQPIQAAPLSVLRAVAASGHQRKLAIAFTHFDLVTGANLPNFTQRRAHVMASVINGLTSLRDVLGAPIVRAIERSIEERCFMLGALDGSSDELPRGVVAQLKAILAFCSAAISDAPQVAATPIYNPDGLVLAIQAATSSFRRPWAARLGLEFHENTQKEHWGRIKALNRRIAGELAIEFDTLKPVADLVARLIEEIARYLDNPSAWEPREPDEVESEAFISSIRRRVFEDLHKLARTRVIDDALESWRTAFQIKGQGSTFVRAQRINGIYESAAPVPSAVVTAPAADFVKAVRTLVHDAIYAQGARIDGSYLKQHDIETA
ncbi:MAG: hypothetical protein ABL883_14335, partial [Terricaulis sp.]